MPGTNRRQFLKAGAACSGVMAAGVAASPGAEAQSAPGGYAYRRPSFPGGSRLLFIGDSITDMKWGRNENDPKPEHEQVMAGLRKWFPAREAPQVADMLSSREQE